MTQADLSAHCEGAGNRFRYAPSNVNCDTALPSGQTVGQVVNHYRSEIQSFADASDGAPGTTTAAFYDVVKSNGPIDFKNIFAGQADPSLLGQEGNFAYYAIGTGMLPTSELDAGAGAYALYSAILGKKPFSTLTGPMLSDSSAASVRNAGLASNGCRTQ